MGIDIFNPPISKTVDGIEGKLILIHSDERKLGKTKVGTELPKPLYLRFEAGLNGISGIPYIPLTDWASFKEVNSKLTNPRTLDKVKEQYTTIIFDTVDVAIKWCDFYICASQGVKRLNDGNSGYGLWSEYEKEWFKEINKLTNAGFCVYFISHSAPVKKVNPETHEEYEQMCPKGDKRTIDLIVDLADFIGFVKSNGVDSEGNEILSSCYFVETPQFLAGSRFTHMTPKLEVFSAKNLQKAIKEAVQVEAKTGGQTTNFEELKKEEASEIQEELPFEELVDECRKYLKALWADYQEGVTEILGEYLGDGVALSEAKKSQVPQLKMILFSLKELASEHNVSV